jgi:hypothetical protein
MKMSLWNRPRQHPDPTSGHAAFAGHHSDTPIALHDARLPPQVRALAQSFGTQAACVHRMQTDKGIEWWLMGHEGDLLEALWFE